MLDDVRTKSAICDIKMTLFAILGFGLDTTGHKGLALAHADVLNEDGQLQVKELHHKLDKYSRPPLSELDGGDH